jgi:hypothetical protein
VAWYGTIDKIICGPSLKASRLYTATAAAAAAVLYTATAAAAAAAAAAAIGRTPIGRARARRSQHADEARRDLLLCAGAVCGAALCVLMLRTKSESSTDKPQLASPHTFTQRILRAGKRRGGSAACVRAFALRLFLLFVVLYKTAAIAAPGLVSRLGNPPPSPPARTLCLPQHCTMLM